MTFKATEIISSNIGDILRFRCKNSYIDIELSYFKAIAELNSDMMYYTIKYGNGVISLKWELRKGIKRKRGILVGNNICTEAEVSYFNSGSYTIEYTNDNLAIVSLKFLNKDVRERLCYILSANVGIPINCIYTGVKDSEFAFEISKYNYSKDIENKIGTCLRNVFKGQSIAIDNIEKENGVNGIEYHVTLAVV